MFPDKRETKPLFLFFLKKNLINLILSPTGCVAGTAQRGIRFNKHHHHHPSVLVLQNFLWLPCYFPKLYPHRIALKMSNLRAVSQPRRASGEFASSTATSVDSSTSQTDIQTSSLIQLSPRVSRTPEPVQKEVIHEEEEKRCWICYTSDAEEEAPKSDWKSPCRCTLIAHESCLLEWIADLQRSENNNSGGKISCPQCKTQIRLKQKRSMVLEVVEGAGRAVGKAVPVLILAGLPPRSMFRGKFLGQIR